MRVRVAGEGAGEGAVIPAKAGIQKERSSSAVRTAYCGGSAPSTLGSLSLDAQRKGRKKRAPDAASSFRSAALGPTRVPRDFLSRGTVAHVLWATPTGRIPKAFRCSGAA